MSEPENSNDIAPTPAELLAVADLLDDAARAMAHPPGPDGKFVPRHAVVIDAAFDRLGPALGRVLDRLGAPDWSAAFEHYYHVIDERDRPLWSRPTFPHRAKVIPVGDVLVTALNELPCWPMAAAFEHEEIAPHVHNLRAWARDVRAIVAVYTLEPDMFAHERGEAVDYHDPLPAPSVPTTHERDDDRMMGLAEVLTYLKPRLHRDPDVNFLRVRCVSGVLERAVKEGARNGWLVPRSSIDKALKGGVFTEYGVRDGRALSSSDLAGPLLTSSDPTNREASAGLATKPTHHPNASIAKSPSRRIKP